MIQNVFRWSTAAIVLLAWPAVLNNHLQADEPSAEEANSENRQRLPRWRLRPGLTFQVSCTTQRKSNVSVGSHSRQTTQTDRTLLQYTIYSPSGNGSIGARVQILSLNRLPSDAENDAAEESPDLSRWFRSLDIPISIHSHGRLVRVPELRFLLRRPNSPQSEILTKLYGHDAFQSLIALPFSVPVAIPGSETPPSILSQTDVSDSPKQPADLPLPYHMQVGDRWQRLSVISLGLPGVLQCDQQYTVTNIDERTAEIRVSGSCRVLPRQNLRQSVLDMSEMDVTGSDLSGSGRIEMSDTDPVRVQFTLTLEIQGHGTVRTGSASHETRFTQSLTQTWIVSEFSSRRTSSDDPPRTIRQVQ